MKKNQIRKNFLALPQFFLKGRNRHWKIINFHEHIESANEAPGLIEILKENNISRCILVGSPNYTIYGGDVGFYGYGRNNLEILNIAKKYPKIFFAFPTLNPLDDDNLEKLKWYISQGAKGLKLYYGFTGPWHAMRLDDSRMDSVFEYCENYGLPIIFHISMRNYYEEFVALMEKFPNLKIIVPHFMLLLNDERGLLRMGDLFEKCPNLFTDISFGQIKFLIRGLIQISKTPKLYRDFIIKYRSRFLFGTDTVITQLKLEFKFPFSENVKVYRDLLEKEKFPLPNFFEQNLENLEEFKDIFAGKFFDGLGLDRETLKIIYEINPSNALVKNNEFEALEKLKYKPAHMGVYRAETFFKNRAREEESDFKKHPSLFLYFNLIINRAYSNLLKFIERVVGAQLFVPAEDFLSPNISLKTRRLISNLFCKKIIRRIERMPQIYYDEPKIIRYEVKVPQAPLEISLYSDGYGSLGHNGGADLIEEKALLKAVGEGLERFCLSIYREKDCFLSAYNKIKNNALDPLSFAGISPRQRKLSKKLEINGNSPFRWVKGFSLFDGREVLIPAQVVYLGYEHLEEEPLIYVTITTGAATADSFEEALYRGTCEAIERDAFMITYFNKLLPPVINPKMVDDEDLRYFMAMFKRYNLELYLIDITTDIAVPSVMAVVIDRSGKTHAIHVGTKTDLNIKEAIKGAVFEVARGRLGFLRVPLFTPEAIERKKTLEANPRQIKTFADRCLFWSSLKMIKKIDFLLRGPQRIIKGEEMNKYRDIASKDRLKMVAGLLKERKINIYGVDVTTPQVGEEKIWVAKVVSPQLQPLYLNEDIKHLWGERLFNVPVILGYRSKPSSEEDLNSIPHPFL